MTNDDHTKAEEFLEKALSIAKEILHIEIA